MKKIVAIVCSSLFVLAGCAADTNEPQPSTSTGEDLISLGGGTGGTAGWSQACKTCQDQCDIDYKTPDSQAYCKKTFCKTECGSTATYSGTFIY